MTILKYATVATLLGILASPVLANGDAKKGSKIFNKCKACHAVGEGAKNKVGPSLNGVIGNPAAQNPDYKYSKAMIEAAEGGLVWDTESLNEYLTKPKSLVDGTKMSFAGLRKQSDIDDVVAYLETFN